MEVEQLKALSDEALEARRWDLQTQRDAMHTEMHAIVREQERRVRAGAVKAAVAGLSPDERKALLESELKEEPHV